MIRLATILFSIILLTSCGKDDTSEYDDARNQIIGTWQLTERNETLDIGQGGNTFVITEIVTFHNDGTGNRLNSFSGVRNFEWIYQLSPEKISIDTESATTSQGFLLSGENRHFDIIENNIDLQQWISTDNAIFFIDSMLQLAPREIRWEMIRQ